MKYEKILCNNDEQDNWAHLYLKVAQKLNDDFALEGRISIRNAIRQYGMQLGEDRRNQLIQENRKVNLQTVAQGAGPFPVGDRTEKEWLRLTPQEMFINISVCPFANIWLECDAATLGEIYCEEFYPAYYMGAVGDRCQVNVGKRITFIHEPIYPTCRLSVYFRPANLEPEDRKLSFIEFDPNYHEPEGDVKELFNYKVMAQRLLTCFLVAAKEKIGDEGRNAVIDAAREYASEREDQTILDYLASCSH